MIVDQKTAEHYSWGNACDGWHLVQNSALSVIEERMPPELQKFAIIIRMRINSFTFCGEI